MNTVHNQIMCSSRKNPYPPHGRSLEIPWGRGVLKAKILEAKYEAKLECNFLGRGGCKTKNLQCGEHGYFLELHNTGFLLGAGNRLFLPSIHINDTGYHEKKMSKIVEISFKNHDDHILKNLVLILGISFP